MERLFLESVDGETEKPNQILTTDRFVNLTGKGIVLKQRDDRFNDFSLRISVAYGKSGLAVNWTFGKLVIAGGGICVLGKLGKVILNALQHRIFCGQPCDC